jgi:uncharacterized membrane protein YcaP (DUF421 family)
MQYADILNFPDWSPLALSVLQTATIFFLIMAGLKLVGRRVFAQRGPQDLIIIVLVAEACNLGLTHEDAGYWGTICSVLTLFVLGYLSEKIPLLRHVMDEKPVVVYKDGHLHQAAMRKHMIDEEDLYEVARLEGATSYREFDMMMLEGDGKISAIRRSGKK